MKKFALCAVLLLVNIQLSAGILGISVGATAGVERWNLNVEGTDSETQNFTAFGLMATVSPPFIPVGLRGGIEYASKSEEVPLQGEVEISDIFVLLGLEYSIEPPLSPVSLYVGAGLEMSTVETIIDGVSGGSMTDYGVLFYAGASFTTGLVGFFAESGYGIIFVEDETPTNITHIPIRGGIKVSI